MKIQIEKTESDHQNIVSLLEDIKARKLKMVLWQSIPNQKVVLFNDVECEELNQQNNFIQIASTSLLNFSTEYKSLQENVPLYCHLPEMNIIFKSTICQLNDHILCLNFPSQLKLYSVQKGQQKKSELGDSKSSTLVNEPLKVKGDSNTKPVSNVMKTTSATLTKAEREDLYYKDRRGSDRIHIEGTKEIRIIVKSAENIENKEKGDEGKFYPLLDLSKGGMAFISETRDEFKVGLKILVLEISNTPPLPAPFEGEVRSIRKRDEEENFKVGVRFLDKD